MTPDLKMPDESDARPATPICTGEGHWLAMLAHELRTPLNAVCMALEELGDACETDPTLAPARDTAARGCRLMALIIEDVLSLHRNRHDATPSSRGRIDVPVVVADAVEVVRPMLLARRHRLSVAIPAVLPSVEGHASRLKQVLINLLTNAAKFTEPGGGVSVRVEHVDDELILCVQDNGVGMSRAQVEAVLDGGHHAPPAPSIAGVADEGHGIGLSLVKWLIGLQGGHISAHSGGLGAGSEFTLRLPLAAGERQRAAAVLQLDDGRCG